MTLVAERPKTKRVLVSKLISSRTDRVQYAEPETASQGMGSQSGELVWTMTTSSTTASTVSADTQHLRNFSSASTATPNNLIPSSNRETIWTHSHSLDYSNFFEYHMLPWTPSQPGVSNVALGINTLFCLQQPHFFAPWYLASTTELLVEIEPSNSIHTEVELSHQLQTVFSHGREEHFEDGMESEFTRSLASIIQKYGFRALVQIAEIVSEQTCSAEVISEALRFLGRIDDSHTHKFRLDLLESALASRYPSVRDAASLGLASMDDPRSLPALEKAVLEEQIAELKADIQSIIDELRSER